jgi:hypothetical protein
MITGVLATWDALLAAVGADAARRAIEVAGGLKLPRGHREGIAASSRESLRRLREVLGDDDAIRVVTAARATGAGVLPALKTVESHLRIRTVLRALPPDAPAKVLAIDAGIAISHAYDILSGANGGNLSVLQRGRSIVQ